MQQTNLRSTNAIFHIPLALYLLVTLGSVWLGWFPLLVVILIWGFALVVAVRLRKARAQKGLREQIIEIGKSSI